MGFKSFFSFSNVSNKSFKELVSLSLQNWHFHKDIEATKISLAKSVKIKLQKLQQALTKFKLEKKQFPVLLHQTNSKYFKTTLLNTSIPREKLISRGFKKDSISFIPTGTYTFTINVGKFKETLDVKINHNESYFSILNKIAKTINSSDLPLYADVVYQKNGYEKIPTFEKGYILTLTPTNLEDDVDFTETQGFLLKKIGLSKIEPFEFSLKENEFSNLYIFQKFSPTSFTTSFFFPQEPINWDIGGYSFSFSSEVNSGDIKIQVVDESARRQLELLAADGQALVKDTSNWQDIINNLGLDTSEIDNDTTWNEVRGWLKDSIQVYSDTTYLELFLKIRDKLIELSQGEILPAILEQKNTIYLKNKEYKREEIALSFALSNLKLGERLVLTEGDNNLLDKLGLRGTAKPGKDSFVKLNGNEYTFSSSRISQQKGNILLEIKEENPHVQLYEVKKTTDEIIYRIERVIQAYNNIIPDILKNSWIWKSDFIKGFKKPFEDNQKDLNLIGMDQDLDYFLRLNYDRLDATLSLADNGYTVIFNALLGDRGFFTQLKGYLEDILQNPISAYFSLKEQKVPLGTKEVENILSNQITGILLNKIVR